MLVEGCIKRGLTFGVLASVAAWVLRYGFNPIEMLSVDFLFELLFKGTALGIMGMLEGILIWRHREKKYHKAYKYIFLDEQ